jgi:hypothetical protein
MITPVATRHRTSPTCQHRRRSREAVGRDRSPPAARCKRRRALARSFPPAPPAWVSERRRTRRRGHDEAHEGRRGSPVSDAAGRQRRGGDLPLGPQVRGAADRRPGMRQDLRAALLLPERHRGRERRADRDRPQVRAFAHLPQAHPARLRKTGLVPRSRSPRVRDEPAATDRRPSARDRGRADRRQRRRRAARHQREPDLPVVAPLPQPRSHRRDRDRHETRTTCPARGRVQPAAAGEGRVPKRGRRGVCGPARPRPDSRVLPVRAARRPPHGHQPRRRTPGRAAQQDLRPDRRPAAQALLQPPDGRSPSGRSSRPATS